MSERPTPETDAARHDLSDYGPPVLCSWGDWVPFEVAEKLERERDEAREKYDILATEHMLEVNKLCNERDEALAQVMQMQIHANNYLSESQVWRQMAIQLAEDILLDGNASSRLIVKASKVQKASETLK